MTQIEFSETWRDVIASAWPRLDSTDADVVYDAVKRCSLDAFVAAARKARLNWRHRICPELSKFIGLVYACQAEWRDKRKALATGDDEPDDWQRPDLWEFELSFRRGKINAVKPHNGPALRVWTFRCNPKHERDMLVELCQLGSVPNEKARDIRKARDVLDECEACFISEVAE